MASNNIFMTNVFTELEQKQKRWLENIKHRKEIYNSFRQYIEYLEKILIEENDEYQKFLIKQRIKKLKKHREMYYDPCILAMKLPGKNYGEEKEQNKGRLLIKRLFNKKI